MKRARCLIPSDVIDMLTRRFTGSRSIVARLKMLPEGSLAVPEDEVDAFPKVGAELIEALYSTGEE